MTTTHDKIEAAYTAGSGHWVGADWTHELTRDGEIVYQDDEIVWCAGSGEGCQTCDLATADAARAQEVADTAMGAWRAGRLAEAAEQARLAADIERAWGDDPTWGQLARALDDELRTLQA